MDVDCVRFLLRQAVSTGVSESGRVNFAGLPRGKTGQLGGAYDRPTADRLLLRRPEEGHRSEIASTLRYPQGD